MYMYRFFNAISTSFVVAVKTAVLLVVQFPLQSRPLASACQQHAAISEAVPTC